MRAVTPMYATLQAPLFFGVIAAIVTTLGLVVVAIRGEWGLRHANMFGLAAAGLLTTTAFLHIVPKAFALSETASVWLAVGFFGGLIINSSIKALLPEREGATLPREAIMPIFAIAIHAFLDGVIYSVTFAASFSAGVFAAFGLLLHKLPEGVVAFAILRRHKVSTQTAFIWAFLAAAATTPLGVLVAGPFLEGLGEGTIGGLFAVSAGLILFVATGPLMAPLNDVSPARGLSALGAGVAIAVVLMVLPLPGHDHSHMGHEHDHAEHEQAVNFAPHFK